MNEYILQANNLKKVYNGKTVVNTVSLNVKKGRIYGFLGPNGAGKSTTIRMILGLIQPSGGTVEIFGEDLKKNRLRILKRIGALVEAPAYYDHLSAYDNLRIGAEIKGVEHSQIDKVLEWVDLKSEKNKKAGKFSMGMKQRLGIAQALVGDPELLILDEPTNGLDPMGIRDIRNLMIRLAKKENKTIVVSSHILSEMELMADDIGIINKGEMLYEGQLDQLKFNYSIQSNLEEIFIQLTEGGAV